MPSSIHSSSMYTVSLIILAALTMQSLGLRPRSDPEPEPTIVRNDPGRSVTLLNRVTFNTSIKQEHVDNWIVFFCVDWYEICQGLWDNYRQTAVRWEQALSYNASSWQSTAVRFAEVDCATDKPLCNENQVQNYPTVQHFKGGKMVKEWEITNSVYSKGLKSISTHLSMWVAKELTGKQMLANGTYVESAKPKKQGAGELSFSVHLGELFRLLSWRSLMEDPTTTVFGYLILVAAVVGFAWIVGTGLEIEFSSTLSCFKEAKKSSSSWPAALLPQLPELPEARTIVRSSLEL